MPALPYPTPSDAIITSMNLLAEVRHAIQKHHMLRHGEKVIVAVSGGPDSLCLLHTLLIVKDEFGVTLHVAHLNHQLRGAEADVDAQFVADLARDWQLPCTIDSHDVAAFAREHKLSLEEAARDARYAFLAQTAHVHNSTSIAVAHNADDQTETVLMHFLRGSGTSGLRGMLPISDLQSSISNVQLPISNLQLIRPLLSIPRVDIEAYCHEHNLHPRFDYSNLDTTFFRNRLRHELLPILETYNPNIREVLRHSADVIAADHEVLQAARAQAWQTLLESETSTALTFKLDVWHDLPLALQRALLRNAIAHLHPTLRNINFIHIDNAVEQLQNAQTGARVSLPKNLVLSVDYGTFSITSLDQPVALPDWPLLSEQVAPIKLNVPGSIRLPDSEWTLTATSLEHTPDHDLHRADRWSALLDAAQIANVLTIRTRVSGDTFQPQGMPTPVRLTNWMINAKVPQLTRDRLPLIIAHDQIAWVAGFRIAQPFSVTPNTQRVIQLQFQK